MLLEDGEAQRGRNKRELVDARPSNAARCWLLEDESDEMRPPGCKYPTSPCALAKVLGSLSKPRQ